MFRISLYTILSPVFFLLILYSTWYLLVSLWQWLSITISPRRTLSWAYEDSLNHIYVFTSVGGMTDRRSELLLLLLLFSIYYWSFFWCSCPLIVRIIQTIYNFAWGYCRFLWYTKVRDSDISRSGHICTFISWPISLGILHPMFLAAGTLDLLDRNGPRKYRM